jgi:hypothetical protein
MEELRVLGEVAHGHSIRDSQPAGSPGNIGIGGRGNPKGTPSG